MGEVKQAEQIPKNTRIEERAFPLRGEAKLGQSVNKNSLLHVDSGILSVSNSAFQTGDYCLLWCTEHFEGVK